MLQTCIISEDPPKQEPMLLLPCKGDNKLILSDIDSDSTAICLRDLHALSTALLIEFSILLQDQKMEAPILLLLLAAASLSCCFHESRAQSLPREECELLCFSGLSSSSGSSRERDRFETLNIGAIQLMR